MGRALNAFGDKPVIPDLPTIDPDLIQRQTTVGNLAALPQLQELGAALNRFNAQQTRAALEMQLPGFTQQAIDITGSQLRGEIPEDVRRLNQNLSAAEANRLGVAGGGFQVGLNTARNFVTSLGLQQQGLANFGALAQRLVPPQFNVASMFFTPPQRLDWAMQDRRERFQRDLLSAQVAAAPDPADVALGEAFDNFFEFWKNVGGAALGGVGGMGGMMGAGGNSMTVGTPTGSRYQGSDFSNSFLSSGF